MNKQVFASVGRAGLTDTTNHAGAPAFSLTPKLALAQMACTGAFGGTFYASPSDQLEEAKTMIAAIDDPIYLAQLAVFSRHRGYMKDFPAFIVGHLFSKTKEGKAWVSAFNVAFDCVIDNGRMVRNFVEVVRSGVLGRRSLGTVGAKAIQRFFDKRPAHMLLKDSIGSKPSLADVIKLARPKPRGKEEAALYAYLIGKACDSSLLPRCVQELLAYREAPSAHDSIPEGIDFRMIADSMTAQHWKQLAASAPYMMARMNINTFARQGVFAGSDGEEIAKKVAAKLCDPETIAKARQFPFQFMQAYSAISAVDGVPRCIADALIDALELSLGNVPSFDCSVEVAVDVSGSMGCAALSSMTCVDIAALFASAVIRVNRDAHVFAVDTSLHALGLEPRDTLMTNAKKISSFGGGGTALALAYEDMVQRDKADLFIVISDNESWHDYSHLYGRGTACASLWERYRRRHPSAKLVLIDITPNSTSQIGERDGVLHVAGFSDSVFDAIAGFVSPSKKTFVELVEETELPFGTK